MKGELTPFKGYLSNTENTIVEIYRLPGSSDGLSLEYDYQNYQLKILNTISYLWIVLPKIVKWTYYEEPEKICTPYNEDFIVPADGDAYINAADITKPNDLLRIDEINTGFFSDDLSLECPDAGIGLMFNASLIYKPSGFNVLLIDGLELNIPRAKS